MEEDAGFSTAEALILTIDGYEGPIDVLLKLAREQKVDLMALSILDLAEQYLAFVAQARRERLELAADYLVMASWIAYLKSRLLLPCDPGDEEPSGAETAAALQFQLRRLEAMRSAGAALLERPLLGWDRLARGMSEGVSVVSKPEWTVGLIDLLRATAERKRRQGAPLLRIEPLMLFSVEDALKRLERCLGGMPGWGVFSRFLPRDPPLAAPLMRRSTVCAHFVAALELARRGKLEMRQDQPSEEVRLRARAPVSDAPGAGERR